MSAADGAVAKDDFLSRIWSICTTLTEEAMAVASGKAKELGFDPNRGLVPLPESFINLSSARSIIEDAIEKQKLVQLPITVQKELLANLETISKSLQGLTAGVDEVVNLTTAIEVLNTAIWKYGLHNLSDQVLGYQKKLNQLKNQELQISKVIRQLEGARGAIERANTAAAETEQQKFSAVALAEQTKQSAASSASLLEQVKDASTKAGVFFATIQQNEKQSGELTASIKTANNELLALDASVRKFYGEVDEYRRKITQTSDDASKLITTSEAAIKRLTDDTTAKIEETIATVRAEAKTASEELKAAVDEAVKASDASSTATADSLTAKIDGKMKQDDESFSALTSTTKASVTTFQTAAEGKLSEALNELETSSSKLVSQSQEKLTELEQKLANRAEETIEANQKKTQELIAELAKLKDQIREQIQQATGFQLFGAFQARQNEIARSKNIWVYAIAALVVISAGVTIWIAHEAQFYSANNFAFWVKLSLTVPLGFSITFCTVQYGRERRLEEEYAFKSSVSVSLNPYRDLVHSILEKDGLVDQSKYTDFVIGSVTNVFTPPTDKVFDSDKKSGFTQKTFKQTAEIIGTALKAAK
jgi:hypothetical protein